LVRAWDS